MATHSAKTTGRLDPADCLRPDGNVVIDGMHGFHRSMPRRDARGGEDEASITTCFCRLPVREAIGVRIAARS